jgi:hypothetical protein
MTVMSDPSENDWLEEQRKLAEAGVKILGTNRDLAHLTEHHCRHGTWLFIGAAIAALTVRYTPLGPWWVCGIAILIGWGINEWEARKIRSRVVC